MNKEQLDHMNPYIYYIVRVSELTHKDSKGGYEPRCSRYYELEWITEGEGDMYIDGVKQGVEAGDILFRSPGTHIHAFGNYNCILIMFDPLQPSYKLRQVSKDNTIDFHLGNGYSKEVMANLVIEEEAVKSYDAFDDFLPSLHKVYSVKSFEPLLLELVKVYSQHEGDNHIDVKIAFLKIISQLATNVKHYELMEDKGRNYGKHFEAIERVKHMIDIDPAKIYLLEDLSEAVGISQYHLSRLFKTIAGVNLSTYHKRARIDLAKHLLLSTDRSIEHIADRVGYEISTYFYKVFKSETGLTPNGYREQYTLSKRS